MRSRLWLLTAITALLVLEGLLKAWATQHLTPGVDRPLLPGLLHLGFTLNPGMAWGLLGGFTAPLALLRLTAGVVILAALLSGRVPAARTWPLGLLAAGALGNAVDGLARGAVVDYLTSPLLDLAARALTGRPFPIFNLSDILVCTGVAWLLFQSWQEQRRLPGTDPSPRPFLKENP
ncbi:signal peptidase II [Deinococcus terrestris]|uniref:signal peptidase II n=1 Tax=Deinococcus terrestris TaxID=2651870 RepID=UPI002AD4510D|nr:signal peptidase II [Deinococcus terrestris]